MDKLAIALPAIVVICCLARNRGPDYWRWVILYVIASILSALVAAMVCQPLLFIPIYGGFLVLVWSAQYAATPRAQSAMDWKTETYDFDDHEKSERFRKLHDDWLTVKMYTDSRQQRELRDDRAALIADGVNPHVDSSGIPTLMVHADEYEKACAKLGVIPITDTFS